MAYPTFCLHPENEDPLAKRAVKKVLVRSRHEWGVPRGGRSLKKEPKTGKPRPALNYDEIPVISSKNKSTTLSIFYRLDQIITSEKLMCLLHHEIPD